MPVVDEEHDIRNFPLHGYHCFGGELKHLRWGGKKKVKKSKKKGKGKRKEKKKCGWCTFTGLGNGAKMGCSGSVLEHTAQCRMEICGRRGCWRGEAVFPSSSSIIRAAGITSTRTMTSATTALKSERVLKRRGYFYRKKFLSLSRTQVRYSSGPID